jgi:S-adenosyl methyltransferase
MPPEINTNVPQSARVYDYWLGGKDHFPADRAMGEAIAEALPTIRTQVRGQRAFLGRAVRYLARDAGMRQFLDVGTGIPSAGNVHDVAQEIAPDFDPEAMRALAAASEQGGIPNVPRTLADTEPFFAGLELVEPGLVPLAAWRPDPGIELGPRAVYAYGGVARKP